MSLLNEFAETFLLMNKVREPDGAGGFVTTWADGVELKLIQRHDTTIEARIAEQQKTASTYTFLFDKSISLAYHDVVKRKRDGQVFRITQPSGEDFTPSSSPLNLTKVSAEKWELST